MRKKILYTCLFVLALMTVGCSSDDSGMEMTAPVPASNDKVAVQLHIAPAGSSKNMRATWQDTNATDDEMMNIWVVVITDNVNAVEKVIACKPTGTEREVDPIVELPLGEHNFYSFANMSVATVATTLGITVTMPDMTNNDVVYEATAVSGTVDADKNVRVDGNQFAKFATTDDNGFGSYGIPMSNVQTKEITNSTTFDLIVVRMMAKIDLRFYNDKGEDVNIESITLTDITSNTANNLKLLPTMTDPEGHDSMEAQHGNIRPNLGTGATKADLVIATDIDVAAAKTYASGNYVKYSFYVNESSAPANMFSHYFLKIKLSDETEYRYSLIDDKGATSADDNLWSYIARNDYRIIPIVLDDYKIDMIPYDFPAIGVYPASVKEEDGIYTINFHDYGHFHLVPKVTKISNGSVVSFTTTAPSGTYGSTSWGLVNDTFADSWGSWTDATKATEYNNATADPAFYRKGDASYITTTTDGDEVGGVPVWYPNTSAPQWDPAGGTAYKPFIFGYIADPGDELTEDRKVYHEFSINLYRQGMDHARVMTYRLYMILDTEQMMYSRSFRAAAPRHSHGY